MTVWVRGSVVYAVTYWCCHPMKRVQAPPDSHTNPRPYGRGFVCVLENESAKENRPRNDLGNLMRKFNSLNYDCIPRFLCIASTISGNSVLLSRLPKCPSSVYSRYSVLSRRCTSRASAMGINGSSVESNCTSH